MTLAAVDFSKGHLYVDGAMTQNRYGVLLSVILLGLLTAGFFVAARAAVNKLNTSVASANPTTTSTPMVLVAATSTTSSGRPNVKASATPAHSGASPTVTALPQSANVVINSSSTDTTHSKTSLPSSTYQVWCHVLVPGVAAGTPIKFRFQRVGTPGDYWVQPESVVSSGNESYILGPLQTGQWRCLVEIAPSGKLIGSTSFAINP